MGRYRNRDEREYRQRESRRASAWRKQRQGEERRFELLIFVAIVIIMMVMAMSTSTNGRTMSFVGGGILLGSGIIQLQRRFDTNFFTWLGAAALFALGYFMNPVPVLYPLLIMGAVLIASFVRGDL